MLIVRLCLCGYEFLRNPKTPDNPSFPWMCSTRFESENNHALATQIKAFDPESKPHGTSLDPAHQIEFRFGR